VVQAQNEGNLRNLDRAEARSIFPGELEALLRKYKHPRWSDIGVESTRFGNQPREQVGIDPCGTVWVAAPCVYYKSRNGQWLADSDQVREWSFAISKNLIPPYTIRTKEYDEDRGMWVDPNPMTSSLHGTTDIKRGWITLLDELVRAGHLRACKEISYLIGRNAEDLCPDQFKL
jgi:hypothetical protein